MAQYAAENKGESVGHDSEGERWRANRAHRIQDPAREGHLLFVCCRVPAVVAGTSPLAKVLRW